MEHNDAEDEIFNENSVGGADFLKPKEQSIFGIVSVFLGILSLFSILLAILMASAFFGFLSTYGNDSFFTF